MLRSLILVLVVSLTAPSQSLPVPKVFVIGTGGTISGGVDAESGRPRSLSASDLVALVPSLKDSVQIEEEDFSRIGSSSMTPEIQFRLASRVRELFESRDDLAGIVITHGTDSLEETAFFVDLLHDDSRPVVFAAAQRAPRVSDSDGPRNIEAAIRTAISPNARDMGVLVALNDDLHAARYVTKHHSVAVESFRVGEEGNARDDHTSEPDVWYAGSSPQGLFRSEDGGRTWEVVKGFNEHRKRLDWVGGDQDGTPDGPKMHSILVDPRDRKHMYIGMSMGGVFESVDQGADWKPLNKGCAADFLPVAAAEYGHDPHNLQLHPLNPDRLYQQNHCGIYRMERADGHWIRIGSNMPKTIGDIGFPIVLDPRDPDTVWVFQMDGTTVWPRTSPGGKPAAYVSRNAGRSWKRLDQGLPTSDAWFTVKRQAMSHDGRDPLGLYFGTTGGEVWASRNEGGRWRRLAKHLPEIYSIESVGVT